MQGSLLLVAAFGCLCLGGEEEEQLVEMEVVVLVLVLVVVVAVVSFPNPPSIKPSSLQRVASEYGCGVASVFCDPKPHDLNPNWALNLKPSKDYSLSVSTACCSKGPSHCQGARLSRRSPRRIVQL